MHFTGKPIEINIPFENDEPLVPAHHEEESTPEPQPNVAPAETPAEPVGVPA